MKETVIQKLFNNKDPGSKNMLADGGFAMFIKCCVVFAPVQPCLAQELESSFR